RSMKLHRAWSLCVFRALLSNPLAPSGLEATTAAMFTGIVAGVGRVVQADRVGERLELWVDLGQWSQGIARGASVAVDGVCLTAVEQHDDRVLFQVIAETLTRTTLGRVEVGHEVNIERSYRVGDEVGGHEVSGHVIGTASIAAVHTAPEQTSLRLDVPSDWMKYIMPKGFTAVDGASLTVGETEASSFWIHLIPETLGRTTLGRKAAGQLVNVELDARTVAVVETVERILAKRAEAG